MGNLHLHTAMNNVTGRGGGHWACVYVCAKGGGKKGVVPFLLLPLLLLYHHPLFSFHSPPLPICTQPPSYQPHCRRSEREKRIERWRRTERETQGWGALDVHEHADRRACRQVMTAMLSPKIRQTRRGTFLCSALQVPASWLHHPQLYSFTSWHL